MLHKGHKARGQHQNCRGARNTHEPIGRGVIITFLTTGCPKVHEYFDTPLFSGLGGPIMKSFDMVITECGRFFEL